MTRQNILLVLREGGDFSIKDVQLIARHINAQWRSRVKPKIICLWDKATGNYEFDGFEVVPLRSQLPGTWSRIMLYSPVMEKYRPCLYVDLDTAVTGTLEKLISAIPDKSKFITLEDFWQKQQLATGIMWMPENSFKINRVWETFKGVQGSRMDRFLRTVIKPDAFFQNLTTGIYDFKPKKNHHLEVLPADAEVVCFHGKPRIPHAVNIPWVKDYVEKTYEHSRPVTVIIPYNKDRGWLQEAIDSVPTDVQLLLSKGDGNWPENFNKVFPQATGKYIRWLHEDDMLTENCIDDSINALESMDVDIIFGNAIERHQNTGIDYLWKAPETDMTFECLLQKNGLHSAAMMYRREVFEKVGLLDETLNTAEEYEFNLRCLKAGMKMGYCDSYLAVYRRHPEQKVRMVSVQDKTRERNMVKALFR